MLMLMIKQKKQWKTSLCGIEWVDQRRIQDESGHIVVKVDVDDICLDPTLNGSRRHNISNNETLKGIMTNCNLSWQCVGIIILIRFFSFSIDSNSSKWMKRVLLNILREIQEEKKKWEAILFVKKRGNCNIKKQLLQKTN